MKQHAKTVFFAALLLGLLVAACEPAPTQPIPTQTSEPVLVVPTIVPTATVLPTVTLLPRQHKPQLKPPWKAACPS